MNWSQGAIRGCRVVPLKTFSDERGWLAEVFRRDEIEKDRFPAMGYVSETDPGVTRGPHEHREQTDRFVFFQGTISLFLWDERDHSPTYMVRDVVRVGSERPSIVVIPPGVVHAYRNDGEESVLVLNFPNRLYGGEGRSESVDEIRYEDREPVRYTLDG